MKDITAQRFGKLTALYRTDKKQGSHISGTVAATAGMRLTLQFVILRPVSLPVVAVIGLKISPVKGSDA